MRTSELIGPALDWAVSEAEGYDCQFDDEVTGPWLVPQDGYLHDEKPLSRFNPSTDWSQGGPIIEREKITTSFNPDYEIWEADITNKEGDAFIIGHGPTPLIAAMRCYVASKLGNEVDIPEELS